jgi:hypothetical protein
MSLDAQRMSVALGSPSARKQRIAVSLAHAAAVLCWMQCLSRSLAISTARRYSLDGIPGVAVQAASVGVQACSLASHWHATWVLFRALPPAAAFGALEGACCSLRTCLGPSTASSPGLLVKLARPSSRSSTAAAGMHTPVIHASRALAAHWRIQINPTRGQPYSITVDLLSTRCTLIRDANSFVGEDDDACSCRTHQGPSEAEASLAVPKVWGFCSRRDSQ